MTWIIIASLLGIITLFFVKTCHLDTDYYLKSEDVASIELNNDQLKSTLQWNT